MWRSSRPKFRIRVLFMDGLVQGGTPGVSNLVEGSDTFGHD